VLKKAQNIKYLFALQLTSKRILVNCFFVLTKQQPSNHKIVAASSIANHNAPGIAALAPQRWA